MRDDAAGPAAPAEGAEPYVSTGHLPPDRDVAALVRDAYDRFRGHDEGAVSTVYPALERADPHAFGLCLVTADGRRYAVGRSEESSPS